MARTDVLTYPGRWQPTLESMWDFAVERQAIFWRRLIEWDAPVLTEDPVLQRLKVDQVYKVLDRDSQFYLRNVLNPREDDNRWDVLWRSILFKTYPQEHVWRELERIDLDRVPIGLIDMNTPAKWSVLRGILMQFRARGAPVYASAFMATGFAFDRADRELAAFSSVLANAMQHSYNRGFDEVSTNEIMNVFDYVRTLPGYGDFYAWQVVGDLRWSEQFRDMRWPATAPMGPGSLKCANLILDAAGWWLGTEPTPAERRKAAHVLMEEANNQCLQALTDRGFVFLHDTNGQEEALSCVEVEGLFCEFQKVLHAQHRFSQGEGHGRVWKRRAPITYMLPHGRVLDVARGIAEIAGRGQLGPIREDAARNERIALMTTTRGPLDAVIRPGFMKSLPGRVVTITSEDGMQTFRVTETSEL